ncbi:hypothetical protein FA10DRAFT_302410, partial [Acaromyces ingoldii]
LTLRCEYSISLQPRAVFRPSRPRLCPSFATIPASILRSSFVAATTFYLFNDGSLTAPTKQAQAKRPASHEVHHQCVPR